MIDDKYKEIKKLSNYNIEEEKTILGLSWYDYYFHIESLNQHTDAIQQASQANRKGKRV